MRFLILALATVVSGSQALAQRAEVVDGDTIRWNGVTWRLFGIDAPEKQQTCPDGWWAGQEVHRALGRIVWTRKVECEEVTKDRYGRTVGICKADGIDIGSSLVRDGWAWAFHRYSYRYVPDEWLAWSKGLGVHKHGCLKAWEWRSREKSQLRPLEMAR